MATPEASRILLVRAAEEVGNRPVPPEALVDAIEAAGDLDDERTWLARRALKLLDHDLAPYSPLLGLTGMVTLPPLLVVAAAVLLGLSINYLGPGSRIHVLYNPIAFLVVWNLLVYALELWRTLWPSSGALALEPRLPSLPSAGESAASAPVRGGARSGGLLSRALRRLAVEWWLGLQRGTQGSREAAADLGQVGRRFFELWSAASLGVVALRTRAVLHLAAIGATLGAIAGMYVRGLFLEYNVVWRSTFLQDPEVVATLLRTVLGPAALLLREPLPDAATAEALMSASGLPAADWIARYAVSAALFVIAPRTLLALRAGWAARRAAGGIDLGLQEPYYRDVLRRARSLRIGQVKDEIRSDVREECARLADETADFVARELFDARVAERVQHFRAEGGSLEGLERDIEAECRSFQPRLDDFLAEATGRFEAQLSKSIERSLGRPLSAAPAGQRMTGSSARIPRDSTEKVGVALTREISNPVGAAVAAGVATVVGTISGGFGKTLGIAIVAALLHTTGPVGFVLGALAGLVLAGAGWWLGRDRVEARIRRLELPGPVARAAIRSGRLERLLADGRHQCVDRVRSLMQAQLEPATDDVAEQIWSRLKPMIGEEQRTPRVPERAEAG